MKGSNKKAYEKRDYKSKDDTKEEKSGMGNKFQRKYPNKSRSPRAMLNDPDWYYIDEQLGFDSASLPWSDVLGMPVNRDYYGIWDAAIDETDIDTAIHDTRFPGVMALELCPTIGKSITPESAINVAARAIYAHVRKDNSGAKNYESTDLMMYYLAMDSLYSIHTWLVRLYGLTRLVAQQNRYVNRVLIEANNIKPDDLISNLADFRAYINALGAKIAQFAVPTVFPYIKRHSMLYRDVYRDAEIQKCQFYMYVPAYFFKYVEKTTTQPAYLQTVGVGKTYQSTTWTWSALRTVIDSIVASMVSSESFAIMSGDTARAYGEGNCYVVPMITEDYATVPVFDTEILQQIKNITAWPMDTSLASTDITQVIPSSTAVDTASWLKSDVKYTARTPILGGNIITVDTDHPTFKENLVATRLTSVPAKKSGGATTTPTPAMNVTNSYHAYGSELCCAFHLYNYTANGIASYITLYTDNNRVTASASTVPAFNLYEMGRLSKFNFHPEVRIWTAYSLDSTTYKWLLAADLQMLDNYTSIPPEILEKMHTCALLGEFRTPQMGTVNL